MVDVICDTSFLIPIATKRIKNLSQIDVEIGQINFVVPNVVINELKKLQEIDDKKQDALDTLEFIKNLKKIPISGNYADDAILTYLKTNTGMLATLDKELKVKAKNIGITIISLSNNKIILESK